MRINRQEMSCEPFCMAQLNSLSQRSSRKATTEEAEDDQGADVGSCTLLMRSETTIEIMRSIESVPTESAADLETDVRDPRDDEDAATTVALRQRSPHCG